MAINDMGSIGSLTKVGGIGSLSPTRSIFEALEKNDSVSGVSIPFSDYFEKALNNTNTLLNEAQKLSDAFAAGKIDNIHQVTLAGEKADIALQFTMQIRNKIMDAYSEIMRMQI